MALRQTAATLAALLLVSNGATTLAVARRVRPGPPATSGAPNRQSAQTRIRAPASISHPLASSPQRADTGPVDRGEHQLRPAAVSFQALIAKSA